MSDAALSVLVLAWDEAAPAVRTVVAAAPAVGSLLVLLPPQPPAPPVAAPAPSLTPPAAQAAAPIPEAASAATAPAPSSATIAPGNATTAPAVAAQLPEVAPRAAASATAPAAPRAAPSVPPAVAAQLAAKQNSVPQPASSPAVRLLHLADNPLVLLAHTGSFRVPAAPYLGATPAAPAQASALVIVEPATLPVPAPVTREAALGSQGTAPVPSPALASAEPAPLGPAEAAEPLATPDASAPGLAEAASRAEENIGNEATAVESSEPAIEGEVPALADAAFRAEEILDPDPMQELQAAPLVAPAATPAASPVLGDALPPTHGPFGLRIPERIPVLHDPTPPPARAPEPDDEEPLPEEPAPVAAPYSAPDLNNQVIRYARQAVQAALAEGPFGTIYAPAWPTWLAALELRQRSGRPLVLHLTALSAGRQPADTAAGWPAEIQRQALRQADLVLVETYSLARRLRRELGLATNAVRVVPAGDAAAIARALRRARRA